MIPCDGCLGTGQVICDRAGRIVGAGPLSELGPYLGYHNAPCPLSAGGASGRGRRAANAFSSAPVRLPLQRAGAPCGPADNLK
jgi:hypothetical protein